MSDTPPIPQSEIVKVLLEHEKENQTFVRHYEDIRFKITQIIITLTVLLIGASRISRNPSSELFIGVFIMVLGIHGVLVSLKYTERADRHAEISRSYRAALSRLIGPIDALTLDDIHRSGSQMHSQKRGLYRALLHIRARNFWVAIHLSVVCLGLSVAVF